jgi:hypothetical protein
MDNKGTITQSPWVADFSTMTCHHTINNMVLHFIKEGEALKPEIKDIPPELLKTIAKKPANLSSLQELIEEGKEVFLRAYFEAKAGNGETPNIIDD